MLAQSEQYFQQWKDKIFNNKNIFGFKEPCWWKESNFNDSSTILRSLTLESGRFVFEEEYQGRGLNWRDGFQEYPENNREISDRDYDPQIESFQYLDQFYKNSADSNLFKTHSYQIFELFFFTILYNKLVFLILIGFINFYLCIFILFLLQPPISIYF